MKHTPEPWDYMESHGIILASILTGAAAEIGKSL